MDLAALLARARACERRAAAVYRSYAARSRNDPDVCAMWTEQAREEDQHERALARAETWLDTARGWHTRLDGWDEALEEIETRLAEAERLEIGADLDRQLLAALALERTEIDTLYQRLRDLVQTPVSVDETHGHLDRLLGMAARRSTSPGVELEAALVRARSLVRHAS